MKGFLSQKNPYSFTVRKREMESVIQTSLGRETHGYTVQALIDKLGAAKEKYGDLPVVVGVCLSGNFWLDVVKEITYTYAELPGPNGDQKTPVLWLEE